MSATPSTVRSASSVKSADQRWVQTGFPAKVVNLSTSTKFIKKLFAVSMSNICYLRTNFPEDSFTVLKLDKWTPIRILAPNSSSEAAKIVMNSMESAMDAFKKGYLKKIEMVITDDEGSDEKPLEVYAFEFSDSSSTEFFKAYVNGVPTATPNSLIKICASNEAQDAFKKSAKKMLRELSVAVEGLDPLPEKAFMSFHLTFTPKTPQGYEIPGYETTSVEIKFPQEPHKVKMDEITTCFHKFQATVMSCARNQHHSPEEEKVEEMQTDAGGLKQGLDMEEDYEYDGEQDCGDAGEKPANISRLSRKRSKKQQKSDQHSKSRKVGV